jgi:hypothetical protein
MASDITERRNYLNNMCVTCVCYFTYSSTNMDKILTRGLGKHYLFYSVEFSGYFL